MKTIDINNIVVEFYFLLASPVYTYVYVSVCLSMCSYKLTELPVSVGDGDNSFADLLIS